MLASRCLPLSHSSKPETSLQGVYFPFNQGSGGDVLAYDPARAVTKQVAHGRIGSSWDFLWNRAELVSAAGLVWTCPQQGNDVSASGV